VSEKIKSGEHLLSVMENVDTNVNIFFFGNMFYISLSRLMLFSSLLKRGFIYYLNPLIFLLKSPKIL